MKAPIEPPINKNMITYSNPALISLKDKKVTVIAIIIPKIPKKFPCLEVSGEERPLKARINSIPEIK